MKILQVYQIFNPQVASGAAKVAFEISKELVERGHEVVFCASDMRDKFTRGAYGFEITDGIAVRRFKTICPFLAKKLKIYITPKLNVLSSHFFGRFDVVHLHGYRSYQNIMCYLHCKRESTPYIVQAHGTLPASMAYKEFKLIYDKLFGCKLLRDASKVIALSHMEAGQYRDMGVPDGKIEIIPNGIDLSEYSDLPPKGSFKRKFGIDEDDKIVLYLGRIHKIKGIAILVKAFAKVVKLDDVKLVVVGPDDGYLGELKALINALKMEDNMLISGPLYGRDKLEAYVDADVYVLPSRYEIWGMTILEAMACRTPIILSQNSGIAETIRDKAGLVIRPSPEGIQAALLKLLSNEELAKKMGELGRRLVFESYDWKNIIPRFEVLYQSVMKQRID